MSDMTEKSIAFYAPQGEYQNLQYPFQRPEGSFVLHGEQVIEAPNEYDAFKAASDELLAKVGLPPLSERIPVIAYGANSNPARLHEKMSAYGDKSAQAAMQVVPNIIATI